MLHPLFVEWVKIRKGFERNSSEKFDNLKQLKVCLRTYVKCKKKTKKKKKEEKENNLDLKNYTPD